MLIGLTNHLLIDIVEVILSMIQIQLNVGDVLIFLSDFILQICNSLPQIILDFLLMLYSSLELYLKGLILLISYL